jgi:hypothetical protein
METTQAQNNTSTIIDDDGEELFNYEQIALNLIKNASQVKCVNVVTGEEIEIDYWNGEASNEEGIPDIVIAGKGATFFYEDLLDGEITDKNEIIMGDYLIELI